jgi:hypothetical protein
LNRIIALVWGHFKCYAFNKTENTLRRPYLNTRDKILLSTTNYHKLATFFRTARKFAFFWASTKKNRLQRGKSNVIVIFSQYVKEQRYQIPASRPLRRTTNIVNHRFSAKIIVTNTLPNGMKYHYRFFLPASPLFLLVL